MDVRPNRKRITVGHLGPLLLFCLLLWHTWEEFERRPGMSPEDLLVNLQQLSTELSSDQSFDDKVARQTTETHIANGDVSTDWRANWLAGQDWSHPHDTSGLSQKVYRYASAVTAALAFARIPSPDSADEQMWNERQATHSNSTAKPLDPLHAHQVYVICTTREGSACKTWHAWLRYGEYITEVEWYAERRSASAGSFAQLISTMDHTMSQAFAAVKQEYPNLDLPRISLWSGFIFCFFGVLGLVGSSLPGIDRHVAGWLWIEHFHSQRERYNAKLSLRASLATFVLVGGAPFVAWLLNKSAVPHTPGWLVLTGLFVVGMGSWWLSWKTACGLAKAE